MKRRKSWVGIASLLACAVLTSQSPARAQSADALSAEAKKLLADGKTAEACKKFEESQKAEARALTLFDLAECHEKDGKTATAVADYKAAAAAAHKEKKYDKEKAAKLKLLTLEPKQPKITVTVAGGDVAGLDVTVDGVSLIKSEWGKPRPVDPGEHTAAASAPGRKPFEGKVTVANGDKKTLAVPALEADKAGAAAAAPATPPAKGGTTPAAKSEPKTEPKTSSSASASTTPPPETSGTKRKAGRIVGELGVFAGLMVGDFDSSDVTGEVDIPYEVPIPGGNTLVQSCAEQECSAHFKTAAGLLIGGEAFVGYAISEGFHLGGRAFAAPRLKGGYLFAGGPAGSGKLGPLWVGASFLVGIAKQTSKVSEVRGAIPDKYQSFNGGKTDLALPPSPATPTEAGVTSGFAFGGNLEVALPLVSFDPGTLMLAAWPMLMKGTNGLLFVIPAGIAFRLH